MWIVCCFDCSNCFLTRSIGLDEWPCTGHIWRGCYADQGKCNKVCVCCVCVCVFMHCMSVACFLRGKSSTGGTFQALCCVPATLLMGLPLILYFLTHTHTHTLCIHIPSTHPHTIPPTHTFTHNPPHTHIHTQPPPHTIPPHTHTIPLSHTHNPPSPHAHTGTVYLIDCTHFTVPLTSVYSSWRSTGWPLTSSSATHLT